MTKRSLQSRQKSETSHWNLFVCVSVLVRQSDCRASLAGVEYWFEHSLWLRELQQMQSYINPVSCNRNVLKSVCYRTLFTRQTNVWLQRRCHWGWQQNIFVRVLKLLLLLLVVSQARHYGAAVAAFTATNNNFDVLHGLKQQWWVSSHNNKSLSAPQSSRHGFPVRDIGRMSTRWSTSAVECATSAFCRTQSSFWSAWHWQPTQTDTLSEDQQQRELIGFASTKMTRQR